MKWILFIILSVSGCSSLKEEHPVVISNNGQKDAYIDKVEAVVSESASALTAVAPTLPVGIPREIVEGQVTRLSGIAKPSVEKVREFERVIREKDQKAVDADKAKAAKVDAETDRLWAVVEEQNQRLSEANALREQAERKELAERKNRMLFQWSSAFLGICVVGILVEAFTPFKKAGFILIALSTLFGGLLFYLS